MQQGVARAYAILDTPTICHHPAAHYLVLAATSRWLPGCPRPDHGSGPPAGTCTSVHVGCRQGAWCRRRSGRFAAECISRCFGSARRYSGRAAVLVMTATMTRTENTGLVIRPCAKPMLMKMMIIMPRAFILPPTANASRQLKRSVFMARVLPKYLPASPARSAATPNSRVSAEMLRRSVVRPDRAKKTGSSSVETVSIIRLCSAWRNCGSRGMARPAMKPPKTE